jgi:hypothetical protein
VQGRVAAVLLSVLVELGDFRCEIVSRTEQDAFTVTSVAMLQYPNRSLTSCFHINLTCSVISASYDLSAGFKLPLGVPFLLSTQHSFPLLQQCIYSLEYPTHIDKQQATWPRAKINTRQPPNLPWLYEPNQGGRQSRERLLPTTGTARDEVPHASLRNLVSTPCGVARVGSSTERQIT